MINDEVICKICHHSSNYHRFSIPKVKCNKCPDGFCISRGIGEGRVLTRDDLAPGAPAAGRQDQTLNGGQAKATEAFS